MLRLLEKAPRRASIQIICAYCGLLSASAFAVTANADEGKGVNGGQVVETGSVHVEFIGGSGYELLMFAVSDMKNRPLAVSGSTAFVLIERNGKQYRIPLLPDGDNVLAVRVAPPLRRNVPVVFIAELANGAQLKARFTSR